MADAFPDMTRLFDQLGLPSEPVAIQGFIDAHRPLAASIELHRADFWSASQADFLRMETGGDTDWAIVIDRLNAALRSTREA